MESELKFIQNLKKAEAKKSNILKAVSKQPQLICYDLYHCLVALDELIVVK